MSELAVRATLEGRIMITLDDVLRYYDHGLSVIPVNHKTKKAACRWARFQNERPSESQVRQWFGADNRTAIAVIAGDVSGGFVCRDFDGMDVYEQWASTHRALASSLPTVATPRPGRHVLMQADIGQIRGVRGTSIIDFGAGNGELRGGGYSLLPPSLHPSKQTYDWIVPLATSLPTVDLYEAGLIACNTEDTEGAANSGGLREHKTLSNCPVSSALSAPSVLHDRIEFAIASTLPEKGGQRHRMLFDLARGLKAIPELADAPIASLKPHVRRWHAAALKVIITKPFDDSWFDFAESWSRVKFPKGTEPVRVLFDEALRQPIPEIAKQYETPAIQQLVAFCRELQRANGQAPFFLATRTAAELLEVDNATASRWLRGLARDRVIEVVDAGSREKRQASTYKYLPRMDDTAEAAT
jgi:hypothetical protein